MSMAQLVKVLRERSGAGMMDCKKALEACDSNIDAAIDWLRENGISKAAKKGDRVASEGLTKVSISGNKAVIFELNSETDFVAKNEQFLEVLEKIGNGLVASSVSTLEEALALEIDGETIETITVNATATIGEKITFRRFTIVEKSDDEIFASYAHMGGTISVLALAKGSDEATLRNISMHIAASNPRYLSEANVDATVLAKEEEMLVIEAVREQLFKAVLKEEQIKPINLTPEREGQVNAIVDERFAEKFEADKDSQMIQNIVRGKLNKFLKSICLLDQPFVMDTDKKVSDVASTAGLELSSFVRYEVGEGIVKEEVDFASEVAAQVASAK